MPTRCSWWTLVAAYRLRGASGASSGTGAGSSAAPHPGQPGSKRPKASAAGSRAGGAGGAGGRADRAVSRTRVGAFAVDDHAGGERERAAEAPLGERAQQLRRGEVVVR